VAGWKQRRFKARLSSPTDNSNASGGRAAAAMAKSFSSEATPAHSENDIAARAPLELVKGIDDQFRDTILTPLSRSHRKYEESARMA
jgi:hypothetical protein